MTRSAATRRADARQPQQRLVAPPPSARPQPWRRPRLPFPPIVGGFLLAGALLTTLTAWLLASHLNTGVLLAYAAAVNLTTFGAYLYDKSVAGSEVRMLRVPEAVLHLFALAGGTPAAFGSQHLLRHKTRKAQFQTWFWGIVAMQAVLVAGWWWVTRGGS